MENPSNLRLFREWKNNVIHQNECFSFTSPFIYSYFFFK